MESAETGNKNFDCFAFGEKHMYSLQNAVFCEESFGKSRVLNTHLVHRC